MYARSIIIQVVIIIGIQMDYIFHHVTKMVTPATAFQHRESQDVPYRIVQDPATIVFKKKTFDLVY